MLEHLFTVNGTQHDIFAMPQASVIAMLSRGLTHFFGSEVASKVKARCDKIEEESKVAPTDDEREAIKAEIAAEFLAKLQAGTVGVRATAVVVSPLEKEMAKIARARVIAKLAAFGIKVPKKDEALKFDDGSTLTMDALITRQLESAHAEIEKEAKKVIAAQVARRDEAAKAAAGVEAKTLESMGL